MTERQNDRDNAAWHAARQWQQRARHARPSSPMSGPKLILTWLFVGAMMIIGTLMGLFFLLVGWLMLPFLRYRMKKRADAFRAQHAEDIGGNADERTTSRSQPGNRQQDVLEGDYEVKEKGK